MNRGVRGVEVAVVGAVVLAELGMEAGGSPLGRSALGMALILVLCNLEMGVRSW